MPTASDAAHVVHLVEDREVPRRLELDLHREPGGVLDRPPAAGDVARAAVGRGRAAGGEGGVHRAVELLRGDRDLGELLGRLLHDGAARGQRDADPAEAALVGGVPVVAGLDDGAGHRVQVQQRDLPVRDAVGGLAVVVARAVGRGDARRAAGRRGRSRGRRRPRAAARRASAGPPRCGRGPSPACPRSTASRSPTARPRRSASRRRRPCAGPRSAAPRSTPRCPRGWGSPPGRRAARSRDPCRNAGPLSSLIHPRSSLTTGNVHRSSETMRPPPSRDTISARRRASAASRSARVANQAGSSSPPASTSPVSAARATSPTPCGSESR